MIDRNAIKDKVQRDALNKWAAAGFKGTIEAATGIGKTRMGVLAAAYFAEQANYDYKVLIITPTTTIRDKVWEKEFIKWKKTQTFKECVKVVCIQTAYKWQDEHFDLVIVDEIHTVIPTFEDFQNKNYEYFKFFERNKIDKLLGLSASIDASRSLVLNRIAKVVVRISVSEAKRLKLISDFVIFNLPVEFTPDERRIYEEVEERFNKYFSIFTRGGVRDINLLHKCMKDRKFFKDLCDSQNIPYLHFKDYPYLANQAMRERKDLIYNASNKLIVTQSICEKFPDRLAIIFSQSIQFADKMVEVIGEKSVGFHSKISKKVRYNNLQKLNDGRTKVNRISAVSALNEGLDVPKCSMAIITSGDSKRKSWIQRMGRSVRFQEDKIAIIVRLYIKGTQEEKWVKSSQFGTEIKNINSVEEIAV